MTAGNAAMGLWVRAGSHVALQRLDGYVPPEVARSLGPPSQAKALIEAGLWLPCGQGYEFHEWGERQPTRAQIEERRKKGAERLRKWREEHDM